MPLPASAGPCRGHGGSDLRNRMIQRLGQPHATRGGVNEPRWEEENGARFNEKWTYHFQEGDPLGRKLRFLYWWRYDLVGSFLLMRDGTVKREE